MKFGLLYEMQRPSPNHKVDMPALVSETLEQCTFADELGYESVWFVEHHFLTTFSASPCPEVMLAALSQRTRRIRLGFGTVILPYHHPVRVAERVAMVDQLSGGRVEFGTGRSAPYEQLGLGVDPRDTRDMWEESVTMIPQIWQQEMFSYEGRFWKVPPREVLPKPVQQPHPPIWLAGTQPATSQIAAQKGLGMLSVAGNAPATMGSEIAAYHETIRTARPVGAFTNEQWATSVIAHCGPDNRAARDLAAAAIKSFFGPGRPYVRDRQNVYEDLLKAWGGVPDHLRENFARFIKGTGPDLGGGSALAQAIWNQLDADTICDRAVVIGGNPESCINAVRLHEEAGVDQLLLTMQVDMVPHAQVMQSLELFAKKVFPAFR